MLSETKIKDCFLINPNRFVDNRGFFQEAFHIKKYHLLKDKNWIQCNWSNSKKNVLRGIHYANYAKLITCTKGSIWDVVVDLRPLSSSYMSYFSQELSEKNGCQLYVPSGCGHGFLSLEDDSSIVYLQTGLFDEMGEKSYRYDCFGIDWPPCDEYILSDRDINSEIFKA